jgi:hypothetical protein
MVKERATVEELVQLLTQPGAIYQAEPVSTMVYAEYMAKAGFIKPMPKSWKDYFFPLLHDATAARVARWEAWPLTSATPVGACLNTATCGVRACVQSGRRAKAVVDRPHEARQP